MMDDNANVQQVFVGQTGSGKTYGAACFTGNVDPSFYDTHDRIVFTAVDFLHTFQRMKPGEGLVFEEAGVELAARNFQSKVNKAIGYVNQTFRHRNLCVTYTVPSMKYVELQVRDLLHAIFAMNWIDKKNEVSYAHAWKVNHDCVTGITKRDHYTYKDSRGNTGVIEGVGFNLPPKKWIDEYEKMKTDYTTDLYDRLEKELRGEDINNDKQFKIYERQADVFMKMLPKVKEHHQWKEIQGWCGVNEKTLRTWLNNHNNAILTD